jgi:hypothetical protein
MSKRVSRKSLWSQVAPKGVGQRNALRSRCGTKCFLRPKDNGFPVCSAKSRKCDYNCKGLFAAKGRASQYKYASIAAKADRLIKKHCSPSRSTRKSRRRSTRKSRRRSTRKSRRRSTRKSRRRSTRKSRRRSTRKSRRRSTRKSRRRSTRKSRR